MKAFIVYPTYALIDGKTIVQLYGRLENGQSFVTLNTIGPYFFIKEKDAKKAKEQLEKVKTEKTNLTTFQGEKVIKITANNHIELNKISQELHKAGISTFEADIKPHNRFMMDNDLLGSIEIEGEYEPSERIDRVFREPKIKQSSYKPNLKIISIDTESDKNLGMLFCIGIYSQNYKKNFIVSNKKLDNAVSCKNEEECLEKFKEEILRLDPDIITGWNIIDFDLIFLQGLFKRYKIRFDLGRSTEQASLRIESNFMRSSSADVPGRLVLDGMNLIRDPFIKEAPTIKKAEFESYSLEDVSQELLGEGKLIKGDNRHEEIEKLYKTNQQKLVDYNLIDCKLAYNIVEKTDIIPLAIERSQLTGMPLDRITASISSFDSLYIREAHKKGFVSPSTVYGLKETKLKGGFVFPTQAGIYHNVLVFDFKSLYPSVIKTFNVDPSSFLGTKKEKNSVETPNKVYFKNAQGILPEIIGKLHEAREKAKKDKRELASYAIKTIMNSFWGVLASPNCRYFDFDMASSITAFARWTIQTTAKKIEEQGYKVIYGDSVDGKTWVIIKMNKKIQEIELEKLFAKADKKIFGKEYNFKENIEILTLDDTGKSVFKPINYVMRHKCKKRMYRVNFTNNWHVDVTEDHSLMGYQSLAFNNTKEHIKHPLKRIIEIRPKEIKNKASTIASLKKIPHSFPKSKNYSKEVYEFMGYFVGDGSFRQNTYQKNHNKDYYLGLSLGSDKNEILSKLIIPLKNQGYIKNFWLSKTRQGDLTINGLGLVKIICDNFRKNNKKIIPDWVFYEKEENIASFLRGLFSADGCVMIRAGSPIIKYTSIDDEYIKEVRKLLYRVGISHSVFKENSLNKYKSKNKTYSSGSYSKNILIQDKERFSEIIGFVINRKNKRAAIKTKSLKKKHIKDFEFDIQGVKSIKEIKTKGYVYDIEVEENHRFFANYVLVHNTDSVFVETGLGKDAANQKGKEIQEFINQFYKEYVKENFQRESFLELQFQKQYLSMMIPKIRSQQKTESEEKEIAAKKRYAGLIEQKGKEELELVGLEAIRGDWTDAAQEFQKELLLKAFHKEPIEQFIKDFIKKIKAGKMDDKLVYRKSIRKNLDEYTKTTPPHVKAARQLEELDSNIIQYVITTEGPEPIQKLKHKIDYEHYIKKQIEPIANQILTLLDKDLQTLIKGSAQTKLF